MFKEQRWSGEGGDESQLTKGREILQMPGQDLDNKSSEIYSKWLKGCLKALEELTKKDSPH